jgi:hypothetical protein
VISNSRATNQLALALVCDNVEVKCVVFNLLAALCLVPPYGHKYAFLLFIFMNKAHVYATVNCLQYTFT